MLDNRRYKSAALGSFIGLVGILLMCIIMVVISYLPGYGWMRQDKPNKIQDDGCSHSIYEDEENMWITNHADTLWIPTSGDTVWER